MKQFIITTLLISLFANVFAFGQSLEYFDESGQNTETHDTSMSDERKNIIKTNILAPVLAYIFNSYVPISITYERALKNSNSVSTTPYIGFGEVFAAGANLTWRKYFDIPLKSSVSNEESWGAQSPMLAGWFIGVPVDLYFTNGEVTGTSSAALSLALGATAGRQWVFAKGFAVDAYFAPQIHLATSVSEVQFTSINIFPGFLPAAGLSLGYAF